MEIKSDVSYKKFLGSTIALVLGILSLLGGVNSAASGDPTGASSMATGISMTLGALAYKSCKKRQLGLVQNTPLRRGFEILAMLVIAWGMFWPMILVHNGLTSWIIRLIQDPLSYGVAPLWALVAYIAVGGLRKK